MIIRPLPSRPKLINNRYELIEKLGEGGMGSVYRAIDRLNDNIVALKQVRLPSSDHQPTDKTLATVELNRLSLTSEFQALASLHHPNIVGVLDYGWDDHHTPYFTMTYLDETENILEAAAKASTAERLDYLIQLLQALMYLHRRGIVHRDLKPDNILVTQDLQVKVLDFGIATSEYDAQQGMLGTMLYMPPELISSSVNAPSQVIRTVDMYAAGLIAYEMFTGTYPYDRSSMKSLLRDILSKTPDVSSIGTNTSELLNTRLPLQTIIGRLISKKPEFRYQDAGDVLEDLAQIVGTEAIGENTEVRESFLQAAAFIGRKAERDLLLQALDHLVTSGHGCNYLIGGESGVGKSRLMEEIRIQALVQGITVLRGQTLNTSGLPYQLWRDIIRRLVLSTEISNKHAAILSEIVPDIRNLLQRDIPPIPTIDGDASRKRLVNAIVSLFAKQQKTIVLLLEDLHWAIESLEVLNLLNYHIDKLPLMIIGSFRDDEKPHLADDLNQMQVIKLGRLSVDEIAELSESMLGKVGRKPEVIDLLSRETEGNVFFVVEVVRVIVKEAGQLDNVGRTTLPEHVFAGGIEQVVQRRLDHVANPKSHQLLKFAAVFGRYIDFTVMTQLADLVDHNLNDWFTECDDATVLEIHDSNWRFSHDKVREHIVYYLTDEEKVYCSQQVAEVVESIYSNDLSWVKMLMRLWHDAGDIDRELKYMAIRVDQLVKYLGEYARVKEYCDYALAILDEDDVRCVDFLNPLSQMSWREGQYQRGYDYATHANTLAKTHDYTLGLAESYNNLGNTAFYLGHYQTALIYYRHSADIHHEIGNHWNWGLNLQNLGWTYPYVGDYESAWDFVEQGQAIFIELNEGWGIANGFYIMALIATHEGDYEDAVEFHKKSLDLNDQFDDAWSKVLNFLNLGFVYIALENYKDAQSIFKLCLQICLDMGFSGNLLEALAGIAHLYLHQNHFKYAASMIGMIQVQSAMNHEVFLRLQPVLDKLSSVMPADELHKVIQQGESVAVDDFVRQFLR